MTSKHSCKIKLSKVSTPDLKVHLRPERHQSSYDELHKDLVREFTTHKRWTDECTRLLSSNVAALYNYDGLSYCMSRAYGHVKYRVLINPKMVLCYHPSCLSKGTALVRLKSIFDIASYFGHLKNHNADAIGGAMEKRFKAIVDNMFITDEELDDLSMSPFVMNPDIRLTKLAESQLSDYGIVRDFDGIYICFWKEKMISAGIIKQSYLTFQEDEALIHCLLHFPNPVRSWLKWPTLSLYAMKLFTSLGSAALNLYHGIMRNRLTNTPATDVNEFCKEINHPSPSVTTCQHHLPALNYDSQIEHKSEQIFHLTLLEKNKDVPCYSNDQVKRYPSTQVIDEQEINQGTFVYNGRLYGLKTPMTADDVRKIGLSKLGDYILSNNPFVTCVREYRQTDFAGLMCSNTFTSFECGAMNAETCKEQLDKVVQLANSCLSCLISKMECKYSRIDEPCSNCLSLGVLCVSMIVFHVLWDMGSCHKKCKNIAPQIELNCHSDDFFDPSLFTIGFGGLHLAKAVINALRNHVLTYKGMNYGMNILRAIKKQAPSLENLKQAVLVAKDRQSDLLSYLTTGLLVMQALKELMDYHVQRVPEISLSYTQNAKTQKDILNPVAVTTNRNGDVFILDKGCACVHVVDRCVVSRVFIIGKYQKPCTQNYGISRGPVTASEVKLSDQLTDIVSSDSDDVYILDQGRKEIVIVPDVITAKTVVSKKIHILSLDVLSIAHDGNCLLLLVETDGKSVIKFITPNFPKSEDYILKISYKTIQSWSPQLPLRWIFSISHEFFGAVNEQSMICTYQVCGKNKKISNEEPKIISSECKPCISNSDQLYVLKNGTVQMFSVKHDKKEKHLSFTFEKEISATEVKCFSSWGSVLFVVKQLTFMSHSLVEFGPLTFGYNLSEAMNSFYESISYARPGHGVTIKKLTLSECIEKATPIVTLLKDMTESLKIQYTTRAVFLGEFGTPWTKTVNCLIETVDSWKALVRRLDGLHPGLSSQIYPHSITNESWIEHSFGFTKKTGQGHSQNTKEYVQSKRRVAMDFAIRTTDAPFCQYTKVKIKDKGYQSMVDVGKTKLSLYDITQIFRSTRSRTSKELDTEENLISDEDQLLLYKAFLFTKSVPRQSNRAKWRESSGYQPNLLLDQVVAGSNRLQSGDMVFTRGLEDELLYLLIKKTVQLNGKSESVTVSEVGKSTKKMVPLHKLLLDRGYMATVPARYYKIVEGSVLFDDLVQELITSLNASVHTTGLHSDEEWALLFDVEKDVDVDEQSGDDASDVDMDVDIPSGSGNKCKSGSISKKKQQQGRSPPKKRMLRIESESDEEEEEQAFNKLSLDEKLVQFWKGLLPPVSEEVVKSSWVAFVHTVKKKHQLIFAKLKQRFLYDDDGSELEKTQWEVKNCCKPYRVESKTSIIEEVPGGEIDIIDIYNIIYHFTSSEITYDRLNHWYVSKMDNVVDIFKSSLNVDRRFILIEGMKNAMGQHDD